MRSMPQALLWEMLSHGRWSLAYIFLLANMLPLLVYGALSGLTIDARAQEFIALQVGFLGIVLFQLACGVAFAQGAPSRLYGLPISTNSIVAWQMFSGAILLAIEMAAAAWLFNTLFNVQWPIVGPVLFAAAVWSAVQVFLSVSSLQSLPAFLIAGTPAVLLCCWFPTRYGSYCSPPKHYWTEVTTSEVATLLGTFAICYLMTTYSVGFARCGERVPTFGIVKWVERQWEAFMTSRNSPTRFRSAASAQLWYEWQVKGVALPLVTVIMLACAIVWGIGALYLQKTTLSSFHEVVLFLGGFVALLACPTGVFFGLEVDSKATGQRDTQLGDSIAEMQLESGMGSYLCSRPFASKDFANAILRAVAHASLAAWSFWFALFASCLLAMWLWKQHPNSYMPRDTGLLFIPLTILGPWVAMANLASIGLSGRGARIVFTLVASIVVYCVAFGVIKYFSDALVVMQLHTICTTIFAALIVLATVWAYRQAQKKQHITLTTSILASVVGCALLIAGIMLRPDNASFIFYPTLVIFLTLVVLPIASTPLAITWNRHR